MNSDALQPWRGCLFMLGSTVLFAAMHVNVRLATETLDPLEVVFFRNLFGVVALTPFILRGGFSIFRTRQPGLHAVRSLLNIVAMSLFFVALSLSPLTKIQALTFTAPIFTMLLAAMFLRERIRRNQWIAVFIAFVGAMLIIRPGFVALDTGAILTIMSAAVWAVTMIIIKRLSETDSAVTVTAWMVVLMSTFSLGPALMVWKTPSGIEWVYLLTAGILGTLAHMLLTQSFRLAPASVVLPLDFGKVIWGAILAWFVFQETVGAWTWLGAILIFSTATWITLQQRSEHTP